MKQKKEPVKKTLQELEDEVDVSLLTKQLRREVNAPPIEEVLKAAEQAVQQAVKAKQKRRHICRVCEEETCNHYERMYPDTGEEVDMRMNPDTGELMVDRDGKGGI